MKHPSRIGAKFDERKNERLTCVQKKMILEIGLLAEASIADGTLVRPVAVVDVSVGLQVTGCWKRLSTHVALVGLVL